MSKSIIILGGAGYLGLSLAQYLNNRNEYHVAIGDMIRPSITQLEFIPVNILNEGSLSEVLKNYDYAINCTGQITTPIGLCYQLNTSGITNIVKTIHDHKTKLIQISTSTVYGSIDYASEETPVNPESPYSACKAFAEFNIIDKLITNRYCILRISNLYGESQPKGLFAYLIRSFQSDRLLEFNNDGTLLRYFINIVDCIKAIEIALLKDLSGIYNVSANDRHSVREIINLIENCSGIEFNKHFEMVKPVENIKVLDCSKFETQTGFQPSKDVTSYIKENFGS